MSQYIERPIDFAGGGVCRNVVHKTGTDTFCATIHPRGGNGGAVAHKAVCPVLSRLPTWLPHTRLNLGHTRKDFTTVNFDSLDHCQPRVNVVERPHAGAGGRGIGWRGHHELMLPWVAAALLEREP